MERVLFTVITELVELKAFLQLLLVLVRVVVHPSAHSALEIDEIVLRHRFNFSASLLWAPKRVNDSGAACRT